jgi:transcriptional regulator with XRE-family HTH domain
VRVKLLRVKALIAERDERHCDVAAGLDVSPGTFTNVVNGHVIAWPALRARMADYFDVPEADLFDDA